MFTNLVIFYQRCCDVNQRKCVSWFFIFCRQLRIELQNLQKWRALILMRDSIVWMYDKNDTVLFYKQNSEQKPKLETNSCGCHNLFQQKVSFNIYLYHILFLFAHFSCGVLDFIFLMPRRTKNLLILKLTSPFLHSCLAPWNENPIQGSILSLPCIFFKVEIENLMA